MPLYILLAVGALLLCGCSEKDPGEVDLPASELASAAETVPAVSTGTVVGTDKAIGLDKTSSVLCFSTEGDTDPEQYRRIVWEGEYPTC